MQERPRNYCGKRKKIRIRTPKLISLLPKGMKYTDAPKFNLVKPNKSARGYYEYMTHGLKPYYAKKTSNLQEEIYRFKSQEQFIMFIDEIQFASQEDLIALKRAVELGFYVVVAGLDTDFRREPFTAYDILIHEANATLALSARCHICGKKAWYTQRLHADGTPASKDEPVIVLDGSDDIKYEARCIKHHVICPASSRNRLER